ncbi:hypothetical protein NAPIS_ORF00077 [Vairimorpha apis BRL 01]|uniref:Uncharacterized protein n=1 Tax=Vairimorpha apis BRL 01 TaxID=1037528 RepID=T0MMX8_9MICR|nr:hypothetical protein NAPIS_ORF00077 [Vairimorpha apis BRL 01]
MNILLGCVFFKNNYAVDNDNFKINDNNLERININKQVDISEEATYDLNNAKYNFFKKSEEIENFNLNINDKKIIENPNEETLEINLFEKENLSKKLSDFNYSNDINQNAINYYIKNYNNIQNVLELCYRHMKENINELINFNPFIYLFNLLEHDTINVLNGLKFLNEDNEDINNIILKLDQWQPYQYKLPIFLEALKNLIDLDYKIDCFLNPKTCQYIDKILQTKSKKLSSLRMFRNKINNKFNLNEKEYKY